LVNPLVKKLVPAPLRPAARRLYRLLIAPTAAQVFAKIYQHNVWGGEEGEYYSGVGSHAPSAVGPYLQAVGNYLNLLSPKPVVVDLGCGDFSVSRHLVPFASRFIGCDVVREIIRQNRRSFPGVEFRGVDIAFDRLPEGDVCIVRQVFQHLDNRRVSAALRNMMAKYDTWIITEHLPVGHFEPNLDMVIGAGVRLYDTRSGVVLTAPPFNFHGYASEMLCEVVAPGDPGLIRTEVFRRPPS
jgi:SAM-dependent methyltransferase